MWYVDLVARPDPDVTKCIFFHQKEQCFEVSPPRSGVQQNTCLGISVLSAEGELRMHTSGLQLVVDWAYILCLY